MKTIAIIIVVIGLVIKLFVDFKLWKKHKSPNHPKEWALLALFCVPSIILFGKESQLDLYISLPLSAIMIAFFIWFFFDGIYNLLRKFNWWFTGSDDKDDAFTDNILQKLKLWQHVLIKLLPLIASITYYVITMK